MEIVTPEAVFQPFVLACLQAHMDAENAHDVAAIMATYGDSPRLSMNGQVFAGTQRVRSFYEQFGFGDEGAFSGLAVGERLRHVTGRVIVVEQTLSGVHTGRWHGHQPSRMRFSLPICSVHTFTAQARLARVDMYFDSYQLQLQLGLRSAV